MRHPNFDRYAVVDVCKSAYGEVEESYLSVECPEKRKMIRLFCQKYPKRQFDPSLPLAANEEVSVNPPAWTGNRRLVDVERYSYYTVIWLRINCAHALAEYSDNIRHEKITLFINAHLPIIRYFDSIEDPADEFIQGLHMSLGKTHFDEDRNLIATTTTRVQTRPYPLQVLRAHYPKHLWTIEEVIPALTRAHVRHIEESGYGRPEKDEITLACLYVMVQCKDLHALEEDARVRDSLWFYHCCFLDYLRDPGKAYPYDNRCFTSYDLPDAFHVLTAIPLWGEQVPFEFPLGKFIQKSLPFAGARRTLIDQTSKMILKNDAFWNVFSSIFYCMLMDTYPEHVSKSRERCFNLQRLLDITDLVSQRDALRAALSRDDLSTKENDQGCYIVFTAFRMWMVHMCHGQTHYQEAVVDCMDWALFESQVVDMAEKIRSLVRFDRGSDVFCDARELLCQNNKSTKMRVYRYRPSSVIDTVLGHMMESLEKSIKRGEVIELSIDAKNRIMNALTHVAKQEWLTADCISILRCPEFGGVSEFAVMTVLSLIDVFYESNAKPKEFEHGLSQLQAHEFSVVSWYFHVLSIISRVEFQALTLNQVTRIDEAMMTSRFILYPGQTLPRSAFNVFFTVCCGKIKTLMGSNDYGHRDISYDIERNTFVCATNQKKAKSYDSDDLAFSEFEQEKKSARKKRKDFNFMQCRDNPVMCIDLRGFMLIYNKSERYMHCPDCGAFHRYQWTNHHADGYSCCRKPTYHYTCHVCCKTLVDPFYGSVEEPLQRGDIFQQVYLCKKHR
jgi:hypothetical protein